MFKRLLYNSRQLLTKEHSNILSAATVIMLSAAASAFLGVFRNRLLISYFYHQPAVLDAYWAAFRLPDMVFQLLVVGSLSAAFIPVFSQLLTRKPKEANLVASSTINFILALLSVFSLLIFIFARPLSGLIAHGFSTSQLNLMASLTRIMVFAQLLFGFSSFLTGIIQSHKRFLVPALSPLLYNFGIIIGTLFFSSHLGIFGPALGVVLGALLHLLAQIPLAKTLGFRYSWSWHLRHPAVKEIGRLMLPRTLALSVMQLEQTALVFFATSLTQGSLTMIYIAQQLTNLPVRMFGIPIAQASLPFFTKEYAREKFVRLNRMLTSSILEIIYLTLPASAIILILRIPLVRLAYGAGSFPWQATVMTGKLVAVLVLAVFARSLVHLAVRVFYALHNTKIPLLIATLATLVNIGLATYLVFVLKTNVLSLAVSLTFSALLEAVLLLVLLFRFLHLRPSANFYLSLLKISSAALITMISLWIPFRFLDQFIFDTTRTLPLLILTILTTFIGLSIYLLLSYLFKIDQLRIFLKLFKRLGNWRQILANTGEPLETPESTV